jgi:hypothetical protein
MMTHSAKFHVKPPKSTRRGLFGQEGATIAERRCNFLTLRINLGEAEKAA